MKLQLGVDIGGTKTIAALFGDGRLLESEKTAHDGRLSPREVITEASESAKRLLEGCNFGAGELDFFGVGVPGSVDETHERVLCAPNLGWRDVEAAVMFKAALGVFPKLLQDTRAAAIGEYSLGAGIGCRSLVCVTLGTGVGCGIIDEGRLIRGGLGFSGELGHFPLGSRGLKCSCGGVDCLELYCSGNGVRERARELDPSVKNASEVFRRAESGDESMKRVMDEAVETLGRALCCVVNLLSPDELLFSGGLCGESSYVGAVSDFIRRRAYPLTAAKLRIGKAALGELSPVTGAAMCEKFL